MVQIYPGSPRDGRTISEFLNRNNEFISRFPRHASGALAALAGEADLYLDTARQCRLLAKAFKGGNKEDILKLLTSYPRENESPSDAWGEYDKAFTELRKEAMETLANRCDRYAATLEESFIPMFLQRLRVNVTGADGKFITDLIQVASSAPPGGIMSAESAVNRGHDGNGNGTVVVVNEEKKERAYSGKRIRGLGESK